MIDLLIQNGIFPDFNKNEFIKGHIGIDKGKIVYIGTEIKEAVEIIDAKDQIVSPGFIDIHMHEENFKEDGDKYIIAEMMLAMGVTTAVGGNCGIQNQSLKEFKAVIKRLKGSPINYIMLSGYNSFRYQLKIPCNEKATPYQQSVIRKMINEDLKEGAFGISFGIEYDPGMDMEEILNAISILTDENQVVAAHYRSDCSTNIDAIDEMIEIAEKISQKFQISHLSSGAAMGKMEEVLDAINNAIRINPRLNYDTYPYNAFSTKIGSTVFKDESMKKWCKGYDTLLLTEEPYKGVRCNKEIFENARKCYPEMLVVGFCMNEEEIQKAIVNEYGMIGSDGILNHGKGHPRASGTFPRILQKYVREEKLLPLIDALRKMTYEPALRLDLCYKGEIKIGNDADIVIFDPMIIEEGATYEDINVKPKGISYVLVNGKIAMDHNNFVNDRNGKFISYHEFKVK